MTIYLISNGKMFYDEIWVIQCFCKWQGIQIDLIDSQDPIFRKYNKGNSPVIIIPTQLDKEPIVIYGFLNFFRYMEKDGMLRC